MFVHKFVARKNFFTKRRGVRFNRCNHASQQGKLDQQNTIRTTLTAEKLPQEQRPRSKVVWVKTESACLDARGSLDDTIK